MQPKVNAKTDHKGQYQGATKSHQKSQNTKGSTHGLAASKSFGQAKPVGNGKHRFQKGKVA
jgi:hypothetical protein